MLDYYCYVYYDENWIAYYVGKGSKYRKTHRRPSIDVPPQDHIQVFEFDTDWEAYECERELICFWGRQIDNGSLMNLALGGLGTPGVPNRHNCLLASEAALEVNRVPITLIHIETNEVRSFSGVRVAARELELNPGCISQVRIGNRQTHKGWRVLNECN